MQGGLRAPRFSPPRPSIASIEHMPIKLENVGIAVRDIEEAVAFFTDLGLALVGRDTVSGE